MCGGGGLALGAQYLFWSIRRVSVVHIIVECDMADVQTYVDIT